MPEQRAAAQTKRRRARLARQKARDNAEEARYIFVGFAAGGAG